MKILNKKSLVAAGCGALVNLAFAPFHIFLVLFVSLPLFYAMLQQTKNKKETFWLAWSYGFGYFLAGVYWISISLLVDAASFGWLVPFALTLIPGVLALYFVVFALSYKTLIKKFSLSQNYEKFIVFALCFVFFEIVRAFLFTGFPWNLLGYVWMFDDRFIQIASIFGVWGLSLFAVLVALLPAIFFQISGTKFLKVTPTKSDKIYAMLVLAMVAASFIFGWCRIDDTKILQQKNAKLRLIQGNIKQEMKWDEREKYRNLLKHIKMSEATNSADVAAVIWSETSVPYAVEPTSELVDNLKLAVPNYVEQGGILITGGLRLEHDAIGNISQVWNSVFAVDSQGIAASYDKHHLVPFGEYVPLQKYLPFVQKITNGAIGFSQGSGPRTLHGKNFSFSPLLCYEVIFPDAIIDKSDRPDLLVNLTNDAWFGNSSGPYQHFDMARMRAVEYGIPLVRVANTGISAFFDPFGRVITQINLNQEEKIDVKMVKNLEPTTYSKYCFVPLFLLGSLLIFLPLIKNVIRQNYTS